MPRIYAGIGQQIAPLACELMAAVSFCKGCRVVSLLEDNVTTQRLWEDINGLLPSKCNTQGVVDDSRSTTNNADMCRRKQPEAGARRFYEDADLSYGYGRRLLQAWSMPDR